MCIGCGCFVHRAGIDVHHLTYDRLGDELPEDLAVMCNGCHSVLHEKLPPKWWVEINGAKGERLNAKGNIQRFKESAASFIREGVPEDTAYQSFDCPACHGTGYRTRCAKCNGWGLYGGEQCAECKGSGCQEPVT